MGSPTAASAATNGPASAGSDGHITGYGGKAYRSYVLTALLVVYILNFLDRGLLGVVSEPVMNELKITDGQFGLLTGLAFAVFYAIVGIPLAHLAETKNRVWIMTICIAVWSGATALCGMAREINLGFVTFSGFVVLLACRVLVGVGEAGCTPPSNSLIADYYPPHRRSTALGYYAMGVTVGTLSANLIGGPVVTTYGWRWAFVLIGLIGIGLAVLFRLTVREAPRGYSEPPGVVKPARANFGEVLKEVTSRKTFWYMAIAATLCSFCGYGITTFQTSFLRRTFEISQNEATLLFNVPSAFAASVGVFFTGWLAEKIVKRHPNAIAWLPAAGLLIAVPPYLIAFSTDNKWVALVGICLGAGVKYGYLAAQYTIVQDVVGIRSRATATAILMLIINLFGYGGGPPFIGYVSDTIFHMDAVTQGFGDLVRSSCKGASLATLAEAQRSFCKAADADALQKSLWIASILYLVPAAFFMLCLRSMQSDKARLAAAG